MSAHIIGHKVYAHVISDNHLLNLVLAKCPYGSTVFG